MLNLAGIFDARRTGAGGGGGGSYDWSFRTDLLPAGLELSEGNTRVTNVSGGNDLFHTVVTNGGFHDSTEANAPNVYAYYEVQFTPAYSGAENVYDGYIGWGSRVDYPHTQVERDQAPMQITTFYGVGWRGNGTLRTSNGLYNNTVHGSNLQFGDRSPTPMTARIIQNPATDEWWLAGRGGLFIDGTGAQVVGSPITQSATPTFSRILNNHFIGLVCRNQGDTMRLVSVESEMDFPVPSGCTALENVTIFAPPSP